MQLRFPVNPALAYILLCTCYAQLYIILNRPLNRIYIYEYSSAERKKNVDKANVEFRINYVRNHSLMNTQRLVQYYNLYTFSGYSPLALKM